MRPKPHAPEMPRYQPPCVNCGAPAIIWIRGGNVCLAHYQEVFRKDAERYCDEHGLRTIGDKMRHIREVQARPKNPRAWTLNPKSALAAQYAAELNAHTMRLEPYEPPAEREPGSDDE